ISNPSYADGRDSVFALLVTDTARNPVGGLESIAARDSAFANAFAVGMADQGASFTAVNFGTKPRDPVFATGLPAEDGDSLWEIPLFPDPNPEFQGNGNQPDGLSAVAADPNIDYIPTAPSSLEY